MSYSRYRRTAMPMATGTSAMAPLVIAFSRLSAALPGPMIRVASAETSSAATIRTPGVDQPLQLCPLGRAGAPVTERQG